MNKKIIKEINDIRLALLADDYWAAQHTNNRIVITREKHREVARIRQVAALKTNMRIKTTLLPDKTILELES